MKNLLSLKSDYKNLTGKDWTPTANASSSTESPKVSNITNVSENTLLKQIAEQGNKVRQLKSGILCLSFLLS